MLLQKQDDRLVLRCHSKILAATADSKHTFSPVIKLSTVLVRQVATGKCVDCGTRRLGDSSCAGAAIV